jgi:hypothetical protein
MHIVCGQFQNVARNSGRDVADGKFDVVNLEAYEVREIHH